MRSVDWHSDHCATLALYVLDDLVTLPFLEQLLDLDELSCLTGLEQTLVCCYDSAGRSCLGTVETQLAATASLKWCAILPVLPEMTKLLRLYLDDCEEHNYHLLE